MPFLSLLSRRCIFHHCPAHLLFLFFFFLPTSHLPFHIHAASILTSFTFLPTQPNIITLTNPTRHHSTPLNTMSAPVPPIFRLDCKAQSYDWGKIGSTSEVARFASSSPAFTLDNNKPYAEVCKLISVPLQGEKKSICGIDNRASFIFRFWCCVALCDIIWAPD